MELGGLAFFFFLLFHCLFLVRVQYSTVLLLEWRNDHDDCFCRIFAFSRFRLFPHFPRRRVIVWYAGFFKHKRP